MAVGLLKSSSRSRILFFELANKALARGDRIRAVITLLDGLKRHPEHLGEYLPHTLRH